MRILRNRRYKFATFNSLNPLLSPILFLPPVTKTNVLKLFVRGINSVVDIEFKGR